ncbi:MAG: D-tyrosyl-tRNA(Tyr) deacylase [Gammaproteobacteria bacterium]|nr:MAG: D-tyrosyl-tRNA(Tyr) deacylase [Gammaproteobacteria bacterium]RLA52697.1 MAG: D-tyrosyl-tRNA(Tyr) deacylase [Gammaproteobacteria bacterium]
MRVLLQRVSCASVHVGGECVGEINRGLLVLLGLDKDDNRAAADRMLDKLLAYRVFADSAGRMNCSVVDVNGGVLLVSQFTLSADTRKGLRPGFSSAMPPADAEQLYNYTLGQLRRRHPDVAAGVFAADMQVSLTNDGPVTFLLEG